MSITITSVDRGFPVGIHGSWKGRRDLIAMHYAHMKNVWVVQNGRKISFIPLDGNQIFRKLEILEVNA